MRHTTGTFRRAAKKKQRGHRGSKNQDSHRRTHLRLIIQTKTVDRCAGRGSGTNMLQENAVGVIVTACNGHTTTTFGRPRCPSRAQARTRGEADRQVTPMSTSKYEPESPLKVAGGRQEKLQSRSAQR